MRLRHQLLLVSLLVLCLPWAGCQFVRETESAMLEGQERALLASATAVSLRLAEDPTLSFLRSPVAAEDGPIYFHALSEAPVIDGFDDDWRHFPMVPSQMPAFADKQIDEPLKAAQLYAGLYREQAYLFLRVPDSSLNHLNPGQDPLRSGDHLRLVLANQHDLYVGASAPGNVTARYIEENQIRSEYGVSGVWNHTGAEYLIELRVRPRLLDLTLGLEFVDVGEGAAASYVAGIVGDQPLPFVAFDSEIAEALDVFAAGGLRLSVVDTQGWLLGSAGNLESAGTGSSSPNGLLTRLYRLLLKDGTAEQLIPWHDDGRLEVKDISTVMSGKEIASRYGYGERKVGRMSVPIFRDDLVVGAVVAEQTSDSLTTSTNSAFNRLLFWSLLSMLLVGLGLLSYASLLSFRIRRLSKAAEMAMDERGKLTGSFPVSSFDDEIGDLSRSFDQLLSRLCNYTEYLRTLSGKLSHELKTPLAVVRSSLDNLEQQDLSEEARVYRSRASDGASRLSAIFAALSGASRLEQSIQGAEFDVVDLTELLRTISVAYADAYSNTRITLSQVPEAKPIKALVAPELIVQMLDKLVDNAADFCTEGGTVELSLEHEGDQAILSVSNDGPLLADEMKSQLFDSLVSVRSVQQEEMHLGLGLYIARLIVEAHGGTIALDNRSDGTGVMVSVRLPLSE